LPIFSHEGHHCIKNTLDPCLKRKGPKLSARRDNMKINDVRKIAKGMDINTYRMKKEEKEEALKSYIQLRDRNRGRSTNGKKTQT